MFYKAKKRFLLPLMASILFFIATSFKEDFFEIAKQIEIFTTLFKTVNMNYVDQTNPAQLMDKGIKSMLAELDPYTNYFNEADVVRFKINNTGEYTGIGAIISRKEGKTYIREPYKGYPADKAGLKAGDEILQINDVLLSEFKEDVSQLLKGAKNTVVNIKYNRNGQIKTTQITLDEVDVKAVPYYTMANTNTGYIALTQFNAKASYETREAIEKLKDQGATQLVLDLRGNPGGLLQEAVNICNLFVPANEIIVTTKSKIEKHNAVYKTSKQPLDLNIPLAILIDQKSASASEIVSGALQDLDRAVIIGNRSFGKGLVQRPIDLTYGTQLKVTISRYYTPAGRCIQALDYSKRDASGKALKTEAKNYNAFKTRKGRTVYDGGGIVPDIELSEEKNSIIAETLLKNDAIFNYATTYYLKKQTLNTKYPTLNDNDFQDFKNFLKTQNIVFDTKTDRALKEVLEQAKKEKIDSHIKQQYDALYAALKKSDEIELEKNKNEVLNLIKDELIKRYLYKEGLYEYSTKNNPAIQRAMQTLNNTTEYNKILQK